jgi:hypothetical protein
MVNKIKTYFETLERLSAEELSESVEKLVRTEKRSVAFVIAHIAEMSRRKAALACGYKNLFTYCVEKLHLSEGSVARRLQVANVSRRFPQILVALAENRISLTVAGHLAPHLREDNVDKLLSDCAWMTKRAVEEYLVALKPKPVFNPSIRKRPSSKGEHVEAQPEGQKETAQEREQIKESCPTPAAEDTPSQPQPSASANVLEPARPDVFNFRFSADGKFKAKFERLGGSPWCRESLEKHGRGFREGGGYFAREKGSEEEARTAAREGAQAKCGPREILPGQDSD